MNRNKLFTKREREIVYYTVEEAMSAKMVASIIGTSPSTVRTVLKRLYRKYELRSNMELGNFWNRNEFIMIRKDPKVIPINPTDPKVIRMMARTEPPVAVIRPFKLRIAA